MSKEIVITADIIKSRKDFDSAQWKNFPSNIEKLNQKYSEHLLIPLTIYSGDSYGAVIKDVESAVSLVLSMPEYLTEFNSRIVLLQGEISYGMDEKSFLPLQGPALWNSAPLLKELKSNDQLFNCQFDSSSLSLLIKSVVNLVLTIKQGWKPRPRLVYRDYLLNNSQEEIADKHNISQQYVSKIIKSCNFSIVKNSTENLMQLIDGNR